MTPATLLPSTNHRAAFIVLTSLFFMWGLITSLNDILIPHLKAAFALSYVQAMLIQFCFFGAYFVVSLPAGVLVDRVGYRSGVVIGLIVAGIGCGLFLPSASLRSYPLFLSSLFVLAAGITILQVASNPYVAILGPPETASSRLTLTQAFNSLGTTLGPLLGSVLILTTEQPALGVEATRTSEAASVQLPYAGLALMLVGMAVMIALLRLPKLAAERPSHRDESGASVWSDRPLVLGTAAIFLYVGAEVAIGSFLVSFMNDPDIAGLSEASAGKLLSLYWGGAMVGRFIGAAAMTRINPSRVLAFNASMSACLLIVAMVCSGKIAMCALLAIGLFNSIMFPTIFTLAIAGLGTRTSAGSGALCMAIVGGAIVPVVQAYFADNAGLLLSFVVPLVCYLFIAYYGVRGHQPRTSGVREPPAEGARRAAQSPL